MNLKRLFVYSLFLLSSLCAAQVPVTVTPIPQFQAFDQSGRPLAFGCVFTYTSGTTTPLATYSDYTGTIANSNPVPLSASGSANIWLQSGQIYTMVVKSAGGTNCSLGTLMYSVDGIGGGSPQTVTTVASSTTPSFTVIAQVQLFKLTLTANAVALPVSFINVQAPALITFQITENAAGGWTYTCPSNVTGCAPISTAANATTSQTFVWNGTTILPVGSGFTSAGDTAFAGKIYSSNEYTLAQTFDGNISAAAVITPNVHSTGNGTALAISSAAGSSGNTAGGNLTLTAGNGFGTGAGGGVSLVSGTGTTTGDITLTPAGSNKLNGNTQFNRLFGTRGTAQSSGNIVLTGWGSGATVGSMAGTDEIFSFSVTAGTGPSANPTVAVSFADGGFGSAPGVYCLASRTDAASPLGYWSPITTGVNSNGVTLTFVGTPVAASAYSAHVLCIGTFGAF